MMKIFVDTGAWIALNNKKDKHHRSAIKANKDFLDHGYFYVTSDYVLDESYTLMRLVVNHKRAVEFGYEIRQLLHIQKILVIQVDRTLQDVAWDIFVKYSDKEFSFTDCTSFAIMETLQIQKAFSYDRHFEQYGFTRLPAMK